jgi:hypothetical protein
MRVFATIARHSCSSGGLWMQSTHIDMPEDTKNFAERHDEQYERMRLKFIYYATIFSSFVGATMVFILIYSDR